MNQPLSISSIVFQPPDAALLLAAGNEWAGLKKDMDAQINDALEQGDEVELS